MTLDPQAKALLDKVEQSGILPYESMPPEMARKFYEKACEVASGTPPGIHHVDDMTIPGPAGNLGVRCYRATAAEKPHCGKIGVPFINKTISSFCNSVLMRSKIMFSMSLSLLLFK